MEQKAGVNQMNLAKFLAGGCLHPAPVNLVRIGREI